MHFLWPCKINWSTTTCLTFLCTQPNGSEDRKLSSHKTWAAVHVYAGASYNLTVWSKYTLINWKIATTLYQALHGWKATMKLNRYLKLHYFDFLTTFWIRPLHLLIGSFVWFEIVWKLNRLFEFFFQDYFLIKVALLWNFGLPVTSEMTALFNLILWQPSKLMGGGNCF